MIAKNSTSEHAAWRLIPRIIDLSVAGTWDAARQEWDLTGVHFENTHCLCSHRITEAFSLRNRENGNEIVVGSVCIGTVLGFPSEKLFAPLRRIRADLDASLTLEAVEFARAAGWITPWEHDFYHSIKRKTKRRWRLSDKEMTIRRRINTTVLRHCQGGHHAG
jgi:hypothetical protein